MIERDILIKLTEWKNSPERKPALIRGARQIGKSFTMKEFGRRNYKYSAIFDFDSNPELASAFRAGKEPSRIIKELSIYSTVPLVPQETLIIFDEIQECEEALNSLKYFRENAPEYHIIAAGSLMGVAVKKKNMKVPVGQVNIFDMYPLTFNEFLRASAPEVYEYIDTLNVIEHLPEVILNKLKTEFRRFMVCGGMPEATSKMLANQGVEAIDKTLSDILALYEVDFAKYASPLQLARIHALWHSLPAQLAKENRKFIYNVIKSGARAKDYEDALLWLQDAGLIYMVNNVSKPGVPLSAYSDPDAFKIYACDVGLLRRLARLSAETVINPAAGYTEFKGAMAENAVLQTLAPVIDPLNIYYWTSGNRAEIEYLVDVNSEIVPIEVKAENNVSGRSITIYNDKYNPSHRVRTSMLNLQSNGNLLSIPLGAVGWLPKFLKIR